MVDEFVDYLSTILVSTIVDSTLLEKAFFKIWLFGQVSLKSDKYFSNFFEIIDNFLSMKYLDTKKHDTLNNSNIKISLKDGEFKNP